MNFRIGALAEADQVVTRAGIRITVRLELQPREEALQFVEMLGVLRADEQMNIHETALHRPDIEAHLDIRENEVDVRKPSRPLRLQHALVRLGAVVVGDANSAEDRREVFQSGKVLVPGRLAFELIVEHRAGRMDVRLPAQPVRA